MTDPTSTTPAPEAAGSPPVPDPAGARSRSWLGVLAIVVVIALLAGATAVLFVRVREAQDRADEAVALAGGQDALEARIADLDDTLAGLRSDASATADDVAAAREQVAALRKCVNNALDAWAHATQSGKPASITKC